MITSLKLTLAATTLVCGTAFVTTEVVRPEPAPAPVQEPESMEAMMVEMMKAATPGEEHEAICAKAGKWNHTLDMSMPGMPPMQTTMTSNVKTILGGRFTLAHYDGSFMGQPFEAVMVTGFDNLTGEFVQVWMDNGTTTPIIARGPRGEDGKITLRGLMRDPATPEGRPYYQVQWDNEDGSEVMEMYEIGEDGDMKTMTVTSTRAK